MDDKCNRVVMIVEDDGDVRDSIAEVLADHDFEPLGARDGSDALAQLQNMEIKPSLILLDVMMPVMDGRQFRQMQQADPSLSTIPVVVLTAHGSAPEAARQMDAAAFLRKPVTLKQLLATVERYCCPKHAQP